MHELKTQTHMVELTISMRAQDIAERLLASNPQIIGIGVYIWNVELSEQVVTLLKAIAPEVTIVLGGSEVSYETTEQSIINKADYVITGVAEVSFYQLCQQLLSGLKPVNKVISGIDVPLAQLVLPYDEITDEDIRQRNVYVEASRGCPFKCEFCLSSLDKTAYPFDLDLFLEAMEDLWNRGLRHFRFVDRTFNLKQATTTRILDFFLQRLDADTFLHFELIPDRLPEVLKSRIVQFPQGVLQFEIGIQSFNPEVQDLISRRQDNDKTLENLKWLRENTSVHLHTDLIFGLPGETLESFASGFNQLVSLNPHEIQLGILKRLRGTPIIRHSQDFGMVYNPIAPYNILRNHLITFNQLQSIARMARYWDLIANSGRFKHTLPVLLGDDPFQSFYALSNGLFEQHGQTDRIAAVRLFEWLYQAGIEVLGLEPDLIASVLIEDFNRTGQKGRLSFASTAPAVQIKQPKKQGVRNSRQRRHVL